jgi:hypothetical protein
VWYQEDEIYDIQRGEVQVHTKALYLDLPKFDGQNPLV